MYVDLFGNYILSSSNASLRSNLINYAHDNGFNYLILYDMENIVLSRDALETSTNLTPIQNSLATFINDAKTAIPVLKIGVSGGARNASNTGPTFFFDNIVWYNNKVNDMHKAIDVMHLEYEYWGSLNWAQNKADFTKYLFELDNMNTLANSSSNPVLLVETYLGILNTTKDPGDPQNINGFNIAEQDQADAIDPLVDRALLHTYIRNKWMQQAISLNGSVDLQFGYDYGSGTRYQVFSNNTFPTKILPLFSCESSDVNYIMANFYGDYLWFNLIHPNGTASTTNTINELVDECKWVNDIDEPLSWAVIKRTS